MGKYRAGSGDRRPPLRNNWIPHDIIEFFQESQASISEELTQLYQKGLSLRDIQAQTGIPKTTVRKLLLNAGVEVRTKTLGPQASAWRTRGKRGVKPVYGFTYFEGQVVKHQKEYPILLLIHRLWKQGKTATAIAHALNEKGHPSRMGKKWSWNAVAGIVERFQKGTLSLDEGSTPPQTSLQKKINNSRKEK